MNVLVINAGSSSLKYQLLDPATGDLLAKGDPCTNPNFDIQREDFTLKILPLE